LDNKYVHNDIGIETGGKGDGGVIGMDDFVRYIRQRSSKSFINITKYMAKLIIRIMLKIYI
jgi:hypothetical protein